ncbi:MAG: hypothetical protein ACHQ52_13130 [Candidatus Eisenbacteria bacterium]
MHERGTRVRRVLVAALMLCAAWLVVQNTVLLALLVWLGPHGALSALISVLRIGSVAAAVSVVVLAAMATGALITVAATRRRGWDGAIGREVRHG